MIGHVELRTRRGGWRVLADVGNDADDGHEFVRVESAANALAEGVFVGEGLLGKGLADDRDKGAVIEVGFGEIAPAEQGDVERAEIAGGCDAEARLGEVASRVEVVAAFDGVGAVRAVAAHREAHSGGGLVDAGDRPELA